jgi:type IV pilus assembly protein PilC
MHSAIDVLKVFAAIAAALLVLAALVGGFVSAGYAPSVPLILFLMLAGGWMGYAFLRYRQARQDELFQVIATAVESKLPLAPAIRAYLRDRPREGEGGILEVVFLFALFPVYWLWHQRHAYDRKAAEVAELLDDGESLPDALLAVRGVAPREVRVAAAVGETTGRLADCLRQADRERVAAAWLEVLPRLFYPLILLVFVSGITSFLMVAIMPKMRRIFYDFDQPMPEMTERLVAVWDTTGAYHEPIAAAVLATVLGAMLAVALLIAAPTVRWHVPVFGRLFRWEVQGLVLRMLGALIDVGRPAHVALERLATAADFPGVVRRCLHNARRAVERGDPLANALRGAGLLPASMVPLVQTAERTRTLPWALTELGELFAGRAARMIRRASMVVSPALVVAVGAVVGFVVLGMFMPLIQLLTRFSE